MEIKDIVRKAHDNAVEHGFWDPPLPCDPADETECFQYGHEDACQYRNKKPEGAAVELADAVIRIADLCGHLGIDLDAVIEEKMAYNADRPYKHGKRF